MVGSISRRLSVNRKGSVTWCCACEPCSYRSNRNLQHPSLSLYPTPDTSHLTISKARDDLDRLQPRLSLLSFEEFINQPPVIPRPVRSEHLGDEIALSVSLDAQIARERVDILHSPRRQILLAQQIK